MYQTTRVQVIQPVVCVFELGGTTFSGLGRIMRHLIVAHTSPGGLTWGAIADVLHDVTILHPRGDQTELWDISRDT